jgi:hypothetical protein
VAGVIAVRRDRRGLLAIARSRARLSVDLCHWPWPVTPRCRTPPTGRTLLVAALAIGSRDPSAVEVTAPTPAVRLGPELALELHEAPDPGAVGADVRLNLGGQLTDDGEVDAEQLRAPLQRRRDRPTQIRIVPSPH